MSDETNLPSIHEYPWKTTVANDLLERVKLLQAIVTKFERLLSDLAQKAPGLVAGSICQLIQDLRAKPQETEEPTEQPPSPEPVTLPPTKNCRGRLCARFDDDVIEVSVMDTDGDRLGIQVIQYRNCASPSRRHMWNQLLIQALKDAIRQVKGRDAEAPTKP